MRAIEEKVLTEFATHYLGDALPSGDKRREILPLLAKRSAARLNDRVHGEERQQLVDVLAALRDDPEHPLHGHIMNATEIYWPDVPEMWVDFQQLMDLIIAELEKD